MSKQLKQILIRCCIVAETIMFMYLYCFGPRGLPVLMRLHTQNQELSDKCSDYEQRINRIRTLIQEWEMHKSFYIEKRAREHLYMARDNERVFLVD